MWALRPSLATECASREAASKRYGAITPSLSCMPFMDRASSSILPKTLPSHVSRSVLRFAFASQSDPTNESGLPAATANATRLCLRVSINIIASSASLPSIVRLLVVMGGGGDSLTSTKLCCGGGRCVGGNGKVEQFWSQATDLADFSTDEYKMYTDPKMWLCWRGRLASMMPNRSDLVSFGRFPSVGAG